MSFGPAAVGPKRQKPTNHQAGTGDQSGQSRMKLRIGCGAKELCGRLRTALQVGTSRTNAAGPVVNLVRTRFSVSLAGLHDLCALSSLTWLGFVILNGSLSSTS